VYSLFLPCCRLLSLSLSLSLVSVSVSCLCLCLLSLSLSLVSVSVSCLCLCLLSLSLSQSIHHTLTHPPLHPSTSPPLPSPLSSAQRIEPDMVALHDSRGHETSSSKLFMRSSVIISDLFILIPAIIWFVRHYYPSISTAAQLGIISTIALNPPLLLIDHGHFQYNGVALGLCIAAVAAIFSNHPYIGASFFCMSVSFKTISLYYSPAIFAYMLGQALHLPSCTQKLTRIACLAIVVLATFGCMFAPYLTSINDLTQVIHRMFPVGRGLYEDKVANFWCASAVLIKWKQLFEKTVMFRISLCTTIAAMLPSCINAGMYPTRRRFVLCLITVSLSFFLFSFQVHEKTILFPLMPLLLLCGEHPLLSSWMTLVATGSMFPLLDKDGLAIVYITLQLIHLTIMAFQQSIGRYANISSIVKSCCILSIGMLACVHVIAWYRPSTTRFPYLKELIFSLYGAAHFGLLWIALIVIQWRAPHSDSLSDIKVKSKSS
jgi:alpha-1,3-glucosyltransferase